MTQGMSVQSSLLGIMKTRVCFENIESVLNVKVREGHISFSYDGEHFVFSKFNCALKCGDAVRINGANGSGKSTFAKLLCGLYAPQSGEILFDGVPLTDIVRGDVNAQILYIGQEEPLLNERLGRYLTIIAGRAIEGEEFEQICKAADFSDGDITILQEGKNLSPGQRKKIMMMKYLLLKEGAAVIILDELFAGLDYFARHKFAEMLNCEIARGDKIYILTEHTDTGVNVTRVVDLALSAGSPDKIAFI